MQINFCQFVASKKHKTTYPALIEKKLAHNYSKLAELGLDIASLKCTSSAQLEIVSGLFQFLIYSSNQIILSISSPCSFTADHKAFQSSRLSPSNFICHGILWNNNEKILKLSAYRQDQGLKRKVSVCVYLLLEPGKSFTLIVLRKLLSAFFYT